jgi:hypothetical protein
MAGGLALVGCASSSSSPRYKIGGSVSGLAGTGLVLHGSIAGGAGEDLPVAANGSFTFPTKASSGATFAVTVKTQPSAPTEFCSVAPQSGTVGGADVAVTVTCSSQSYTVGGTVNGLSGSGLVVQDNMGPNLAITENGGNPVSFTFPDHVADGGTYSVTVSSSAQGASCQVTSGGSGTIHSANVTDVVVTCTTGVVQRWQAPTSWGAAWQDDGHMVQHASGPTSAADTSISEQKGITWTVASGTLPAPKEFDGFPDRRWGAGPFNPARYQATGGDSALDLPGDMLVCAMVKPHHDPVTSGNEEPIIAKGLQNASGWVLMQRASSFVFQYQWTDSAGTHSDLVYTPTYFADRKAPTTGPLNPSYVVVCGGRGGNTIYVAANDFAATAGTILSAHAELVGSGTIQLDSGAHHPATIGGYDDNSRHFGGRVYETAVWSEAATQANIDAKFAAVQGLMQSDGQVATYARNREGPFIGPDGNYHTTWRHGPRIDGTKGFLFGLQGWNRLSYCADATHAPPVGTSCDTVDYATGYIVAAGEAIDEWTRAGGATVAKDQLQPPGDGEELSAESVTLPPGASLSTQLGAFDSAGPIHGQIWIRPTVTAGTLHLTTSNPDSSGVSQHDIDLSTLAANTWTRVWLKGLTTNAAAGTFTLAADQDNGSDVIFYAWGADLTQISHGGDLGSFDPGLVMYDWSSSIGLPGDSTPQQPRNPLDVLDLETPVPASTTTTGFCLSADAQPYDGLAWETPFVFKRGLMAWFSGASTQATASLYVTGTHTAPAGRLCFYVSGAAAAIPVGYDATCAPVPSGWSPGTKHNVKGCLSASDKYLRLYADDQEIANKALSAGNVMPDLLGGHLVIGNTSGATPPVWAPDPWVPWNGYVSKALACFERADRATTCQ